MSGNVVAKRWDEVADGLAPEEATEPAPVVPDPFGQRPVSLIREFIINTLPHLPVEPLSEAPTAEEMRRLTADVIGLTEEQLASVLKVPVGAVRAWLDSEAGSRPVPETVQEPPAWKWPQFLGLWALALCIEQQRAGGDQR